MDDPYPGVTSLGANSSGLLPDCEDGYINRTPESARIAAAITCVLSMLGSSSIVLSYVCFKQLRSKAREILVHLSVVNFAASLSMFVGIALNFSSNFNFNLDLDIAAATYETYKRLCFAQATFLIYSNLASLLWTISVSVYCYLLLMFRDRKLAHRSVYASYVICYGLPLITSVWFVTTGKVGYAANRGSGWCTMSVYRSSREFTLFFGYDGFAYLAIILLPTIAISLIINQRLKVRTRWHNCYHGRGTV